MEMFKHYIILIYAVKRLMKLIQEIESNINSQKKIYRSFCIYKMHQIIKSVLEHVVCFESEEPSDKNVPGGDVYRFEKICVLSIS